MGLEKQALPGSISQFGAQVSSKRVVVFSLKYSSLVIKECPTPIGLNFLEMVSGTIKPHPHATPNFINHTPDHTHSHCAKVIHCLLCTTVALLQLVSSSLLKMLSWQH